MQTGSIGRHIDSDNRHNMAHSNKTWMVDGGFGIVNMVRSSWVMVQLVSYLHQSDTPHLSLHSAAGSTNLKPVDSVDPLPPEANYWIGQANALLLCGEFVGIFS